MTEPFYILFSQSGLAPGVVDEDYKEEYDAALSLGFSVLLFNYDDLVQETRWVDATVKIGPASILTAVVYRGWMLTPTQYLRLYDQLLAKNYRLINSPSAYRACHYLPDSLPYIERYTPKTVYEYWGSSKSMNLLLEKARIFGSNPVVLKDFVKSEKHHWDTACFVPDASDREAMKKAISALLRHRGQYLNEGIVIRAFEELNHLAIHSKSGMPLTEEYRLFFLNGKMLAMYDYWEEGEYRFPKPPAATFEVVAGNVPSAFFTMDVARMKSGDWLVIELGDGQVSGLPDRAIREHFYESLKTSLSVYANNALQYNDHSIHIPVGEDTLAAIAGIRPSLDGWDSLRKAEAAMLCYKPLGLLHNDDLCLLLAEGQCIEFLMPWVIEKLTREVHESPEAVDVHLFSSIYSYDARYWQRHKAQWKAALDLYTATAPYTWLSQSALVTAAFGRFCRIHVT